MGYKSVIRSASASANKAIREQEKTQRQQQRAQEKMLNKIEVIKEKMQKINNELENEYAKGKVNKEEFEDLKKREGDISYDMVVVGKAPMVTLFKRYISGKINKVEFEKIKADILPEDFTNEKKQILSTAKQIQEDGKKFISSLHSKEEGICQNCGKKKSFLSPIKTIGKYHLCGGCSKKLSNILKFPGHNGYYFQSDPIQFGINAIEDIDLDFSLKVEHF